MNSINLTLKVNTIQMGIHSTYWMIFNKPINYIINRDRFIARMFELYIFFQILILNHINW